MTLAPWTDPMFADMAEAIRANAGLVFQPSRYREVETKARKTMAQAGTDDIRDFLRRTAAEPSLLDDLIANLTIGETYFFREPAHFAFIRDEIVPEIRRLRGTAHEFRAWSTGCASGEEAYSLAIVLDEVGSLGHSRILATDISRTQLARARKGVYGTWSLRGDGARLAGAYLRPAGSQFEVGERMRQRVDFTYLNLAQDNYPTAATSTWGMDVVLCRNVFIYFDPDTIRDVVRRLYASLAPGGYLIAGAADPVLASYAPFETLTTAAGLIYRKKVEPREVVAPPAAAPGPAMAKRQPAPAPRPAPEPPPAAAPVIDDVRPHDAAPLLAAAREALAAGDGRRAVEITRPLVEDPEATALCVRGLANLGEVRTAAAMAAEAVTRHPTSEEIGFLHAVLLMNLDRYVDAERALRRVLYLDRTLAVVHFTLGTILHRLGRLDDSARSYRNARDLAARHPADQPVPLADGEHAPRLAQAAAARLLIVHEQARGAS